MAISDPEGRGNGSPSVFLLTPFSAAGAGGEEGETFDAVQRAIRSAVEAVHGSVQTAADIFTSGVVLEQIDDAIEKADLIIAVCSGRNANVFFELGFARCAGHQPIFIAASKDDLPFDVQHYRCQTYGGQGELATLAERLAAALRESLKEARQRRPARRRHRDPLSAVEIADEITWREGFKHAVDEAIERTEAIAHSNWGSDSTLLFQESAPMRAAVAAEVIRWLAPAAEYRPAWLGRPLRTLTQSFDRRLDSWSAGGVWAFINQTWSLLALKGLVGLAFVHESVTALEMLLALPAPGGSEDVAPLPINERATWTRAYGKRANLCAEDFHGLAKAPELLPLLPAWLSPTEFAAGTDLVLGLMRCRWEDRQLGGIGTGTGLGRPRAYAAFMDFQPRASAWAAHVLEDSEDMARVMGSDSLQDARSALRKEFGVLSRCRDSTPIPWPGLGWDDLLELAR